ncbi:MAG: dephospho-CoA kinase [Lachnospiraceae bacterium]|nr:dephospho-CoA kinase [Lachnospiraceae bacterium]
MYFIGITGGVGAGKSAILSYLEQKPGFRVMLADDIAHMLMRPGTDCFSKIRQAFGDEDIFEADGSLCSGKVAEVIFSDEAKRRVMNGIVHPAVKQYVLEQVRLEREKGELSFLFLEAALLIEEHYDAICDELWYINTSEDNRRARLRESRGYSEEKIQSIFESQLSEEEYRAACKVVIDNNGTKEASYEQIEKALRRKADEQ